MKNVKFNINDLMQLKKQLKNIRKKERNKKIN